MYYTKNYGIIKANKFIMEKIKSAEINKVIKAKFRKMTYAEIGKLVNLDSEVIRGRARRMGLTGGVKKEPKYSYLIKKDEELKNNIRPIRLNQQTLHLNKGANSADVMFIGDVHWGSPQCDKARFLRAVDYCLENNVYVMLMGDLIEVGTKDSVGAGVYEQESSGQCQYEQVVDILKPLADKKLILGLHNGNHEERVYKSSGVNVSKMFARELGVRYLGDACWSKFKVGQQTYTIYSLHGRTGSRFDGTALLALERISTSFFCDLMAQGHSHKLISSTVLIQRIENNLVKEHKKTLLITGSFLKYDGGYGQTLGLPISKLGCPKVTFFSNKKDIHIEW